MRQVLCVTSAQAFGDSPAPDQAYRAILNDVVERSSFPYILRKREELSLYPLASFAQPVLLGPDNVDAAKSVALLKGIFYLAKLL